MTDSLRKEEKDGRLTHSKTPLSSPMTPGVTIIGSI